MSTLVAAEDAANCTSGAEFRVGSIIAKTYRVVGTLGSGGMGRVYAAEHLRLSTTVAVKVAHGQPDERAGELA